MIGLLWLLLPHRRQLQGLDEQDVAQLSRMDPDNGSRINRSVQPTGQGLIADATNAGGDLPGARRPGQFQLQRLHAPA